MSLATTLSPFSSRSNTSLWASSDVLIKSCATASTASTVNWTRPFTKESALVEAVVGTLWTTSAHDSNGKSTHSLSSQDTGTLSCAFLNAVTKIPRHQPRSQSHKQSENIGQRIHCCVLHVDVKASAGAHTPRFRSSMSARMLSSGSMLTSAFACFSEGKIQRGPVLSTPFVLFQNAGTLATRSCVFDLFTSSATPHTIVHVHFVVFLQLLIVLVCALSLPLFDNSWRINDSTLIQSG